MPFDFTVVSNIAAFNQYQQYQLSPDSLVTYPFLFGIQYDMAFIEVHTPYKTLSSSVWHSRLTEISLAVIK